MKPVIRRAATGRRPHDQRLDAAFESRRQRKLLSLFFAAKQRSLDRIQHRVKMLAHVLRKEAQDE
jgi:hypothetical protein